MRPKELQSNLWLFVQEQCGMQTIYCGVVADTAEPQNGVVSTPYSGSR